MILAAGRGERLRPLSDEIPKPALPLGGIPLILRTFFWLKRQGVEEGIVNLYHRKERILDLLDAFPIPVAASIEEELLGTGGGIRRASPLWEGDWLLVLNGDTLIALDLEEIFPLPHPEIRALLVVRKDPQARAWGAVFAEESGGSFVKIRSFFEPPGEPSSPYMFTGVHLIHRTLVELLPEKGCVVRNGYAHWVSTGTIWGYRYEGPWLEIGTPESYRYAEELFLQGGVPWLLLPQERLP